MYTVSNGLLETTFWVRCPKCSFWYYLK